MTGDQAAASVRPHATSGIEHAAALHRAGRFDEAAQICSAILAAEPDDYNALHLLGLLRYKQGQNAEALRFVGAVLRRTPRSAEVLNNYGVILEALARHEEALVCFDAGLAIDADYLHALTNRAGALKRLKRHEEALAAYEAVLARNAGDLGALNECGSVLMRLGRPEAALVCYERALAIAPALAELHINMGLALRALNRFAEALASFAAAAAVEPERAEAHYGASLVRLCLGEYETGWRGYEWRWYQAGWAGSRRNFSAPLWLGDGPIEGKTILLHAEQGFGDTLQFVRYIPLVARRGATVILECQPELKNLLCNIAGVTQVISRGEALPDFDLHCPLLSLPLACRTELATIPANIPYLYPHEERVAQWRGRLPQNCRLRVGICWAGGLAHQNDHNRSIPLACFATVLSVSGMDFVSLQKEVSEEQAMILREHGVAQLGQEFQDFADAAAVVAMLDLVISVDTSIAHLAAAMGKAVRLLVPFSPDWRWQLDRTDSPWYPTMRLFRQPAIGDWDGPVERLSQELTDVLRRRAMPQSS